MAKRKKKPCDEGANRCIWQFADVCMFFPGLAVNVHQEKAVTFRPREMVSYEECMECEYPLHAAYWMDVGTTKGAFVPDIDRAGRLAKITSTRVGASGSEKKTKTTSVRRSKGNIIEDDGSKMVVKTKSGKVVGTIDNMFGGKA